jgi:hypothetical protein
MRGRIYEQAYDYARFLATANPTVRDERASLNWQLLAARSALGVTDVWQPLAEPAVRTEAGHSTARLAYAVGDNDGDRYLSLQLRPAYHDVLDPPAGYSNGAQINFLNLDMRYYVDSEKLRLEKFTAINVLSLAPRDDYFEPISWGVDAGIERQPTRQSFANAAQRVVNGGDSISVMHDLTTSLLGEINIKAAGRFEKGYSAGVGMKINILRQSSAGSWQASFKAVSYEAGEKNIHRQFELNYAYHIAVDDSLRVMLKRSNDYGLYRTDFQLAYHVYF